MRFGRTGVAGSELALVAFSKGGLFVALGVTPIRVNRILRGQRSITADTASHLSYHFGTRPGWCLYSQSHCDLQAAADGAEDEIFRTLRRYPSLPSSKETAQPARPGP